MMHQNDSITSGHRKFVGAALDARVEVACRVICRIHAGIARRRDQGVCVHVQIYPLRHDADGQHRRTWECGDDSELSKKPNSSPLASSSC
jgi:hypothetical protein